MSDRRPNRVLRLVSLLVVVWVVPVVAGCSTLGIAQVEDMDTMNRRLTSANTSTNDRLDTETQQLTTQLDAIDVRLDSMNTDLTALEERFRESREYVQGLNLSDISSQADRATAAANRAEQHFDGLLRRYLQRLRADHSAMTQEIKDVEAKLETSPADRSSVGSGESGAGEAPAPAADAEPLPEIPSDD